MTVPPTAARARAKAAEEFRSCARIVSVGRVGPALSS